VIEALVSTGNGLVEGALAVKATQAPGTYHVTWTASPLQGAQLWLLALQAAP
jgi:hypothetical protein